MSEVGRWKEHGGVCLDSVRGFDVIDCSICGFKHIIPVPAAAELAAEYREGYYDREKPLYIDHCREDLEWWNVVYDERYDALEKFFPSGRRRVLDVGSGPGFFLLRGKHRGWDTLGIEPSVQACEHSRSLGLEVVNEFLSDAVVPRLGLFDVVHMSEVLEHIPDPAELLRLAHLLLGPGGVLCVEVPNDYSPFQSVLRSVCDFSPWWVAPPHHINYFDPASLRSLLMRCSFEVVDLQVTFPMEVFLLMGDNYVGNPVLGRLCHTKRMMFEMRLADALSNPIKQRLYRAFAEAGVGRELVMFAVRH